MKPIVGLTGGIGSGKSTVADCFARLGVTVIDTDHIAHELTAPEGVAMPAIIAAFGDDIALPQGGLDRAAMRRRVFSCPDHKKRLESILHPLIRDESLRRCQAASSTYALLVVPLLIETRAYHPYIQRILVVDCAESVQITRVMKRSALSLVEVQAIMNTQLSRQERLAAADDIILNDTQPESLEAPVLALHQAYLQRFRKSPTERTVEILS